VTSLIGLVADVEAETPFEHFMLRWFPENGLAAVDNTDRRRGLGVSLDASCPAAWPFATGLSRIFLPAGSPVIKHYEMGSRIAYPGQTGMEFFSGEITYRSSGPQADLVLDSVRGQVLRRTGRGLEEFPAGDVFDAVYLLADGVSIACDTVLAGDSVDLHLDSEYIISRETSRSITLTCDIASQARQGNYLITFNDSTFMSLVDHDLQTGVSPVLAGMDYPMTTGDISITAETLSGSLVNWPNPFNPDKEITRLGFVLPQSADVDIEIFSITGDLVRTLVLGAPRPQGSNDQDTWDGKNDQGQMVLPGTYFCRIKAEYPSGGSDQATRRVAVVR
jgi:hypothetical protein